MGVGSGRFDAILGGNDGTGLVENPGPLTLIEGAGDLVGCEGGSKLIVGTTFREGGAGCLAGEDGPLALIDDLLVGD